MTWAYITFACVAVIIILSEYVLWARAQAASLLFLIVAESVMVTDMPAEIRPDFIIKRCLANISAINVLVRPLAKWYIKNHGLEIIEPAVALAMEDLDEIGFIRE